jgi:hypothetical protein
MASNTNWAGAKGSLIMFRAPDCMVATFWPGVLKPRVHLGQEPLVLPMVPDLLTPHDFWLLALGIDRVRLYRGSKEVLEEVGLPAGVPVFLPKGREAETRRDEGRRLRDFFQEIDLGIQATLFQNHLPLILAGGTREVAVYRGVNTYWPLLDGSIQGNPNALNGSTLHARASELLPSYWAHSMEATARALEEGAGRDLVVTDPAGLIEAVTSGRIGELIVAPASPGYAKRENLINWAVLATIRKAGKVSVLKSPSMEAGIAGILRSHAPERIGSTPARIATTAG